MINNKGFFAIGVEGISKERNAGAIFRTAHAFNADFIFSVNANIDLSNVGVEDCNDKNHCRENNDLKNNNLQNNELKNNDLQNNNLQNNELKNNNLQKNNLREKSLQKNSVDVKKIYSTDTSKTFKHVPFFQFESASHIALPKNCALIGVELCHNSTELPEFCHPSRAAYVLGPERGQLSEEMQSQCDYIVKIPTKFCLNVSIAAAIVIYDRIQSQTKWKRRPLTPRATLEIRPKHVSGAPVIRTKNLDKQSIKNLKGYDL